MATIRSSIVVQDMASSVFSRLHSKLTKTTTGFKNLNNEMSVAPTKAINNAEKLNASALQTEMTYQAELQVLKQVESEARKIIAAEGTQTAKAQDIIASVREQRTLVEGLKKDYDNVSHSIKDAHNNQEEFNNSINTANTNGNNLLSTVRNIAMAVGGIATVKKLFELSDEMTNNRARLSLIVDDKGSVEELQNKIFASSMNARASYQTTTDIVTKLGLQAGKAFKGNDELIAFAEQLNKTFVISGTNASGIESTMYNLTQALSTGVLRGQDLNAVFSNAPQIVQNIADYLDVPIGKIRDMAADGKISAQIVKNAMLKAADETNAKFNKMPMTWNQVWTKMKNVAIKALDPVLKKINQLANNQQVQEMFNMFIDGASLAAQAILGLIEGISWFVNILEPVAPIILGIVAACVAFNIISGITSGILSILAIAHGIAGAAEMLHAGETMAATAAQWGLNSALLACPITWIIILIIALIAVLVYFWFTNDNVAYGILYAWDALRLGAMVLWLGCKTVFYGILLAAQFMWLGILGVCYGLLWAWYMFETGLEGVGVGILYIFQWLYNGVVGIVNGIIEVLNKIPGVSINTVEYANFADKALEGMMDNVTKRNEDLQSMLDDMTEVSNSIEKNKAEYMADLSNGANDIANTAIEFNTTRQDRVDHRNDWVKGAGDAIDSALSSFSFDPSNSTLGDIDRNTKDIADNTKEISEEDLKYLIDIAERDTVNRFTTVPLSISIVNENNINGEDDIDGIVDKVTNKMAEKLEEELEYVSDGVHE